MIMDKQEYEIDIVITRLNSKIEAMQEIYDEEYEYINTIEELEELNEWYDEKILSYHKEAHAALKRIFNEYK